MVGSKSISELTYGEIRRALKRNAGFPELCRIYSCSISEIKDRIYRICSPKQAETLIRRLNQNTPKPKRPAPTHDQPRSIVSTPLSSILPEIPPAKDRLTELIDQEQLISQSVIALENDHESLVKQKAEHREALKLLQSQLEKLENELARISEEYDLHATASAAITAKLRENNMTRNAQVAELTSIRVEIESIRIVPLFVCADGEISAANDPDLLLNDSHSDQIYHFLLDRVECQELRICDIKTLSRLFAILSASNRRFEPYFDDPKVETAFLALDQAVKPLLASLEVSSHAESREPHLVLIKNAAC